MFNRSSRFMKQRKPDLNIHAELPNFPRRRFVQGLALGGTVAALGSGSQPVLAADALQNQPTTLQGRSFDLSIGNTPVNFTGASRVATTVNGQLPGPLLRWREGDTVTLRVSNRLRQTSSIHWHGIILPSAMDGVPGISTGFEGIAPNDSFTYQFKVRQSGTFWYHSHSAFQEQTGLYGPIVIEPRDGEICVADRDYVVMLSDWSDMPPENIYYTLKKQSHYFNVHPRTHADLMRDVKHKGWSETLRERAMWGEMRMSSRDLADVTGYTYTYLMNGVAPASGWTGLFDPGQTIRLRFINGSAMSFFDVRIPDLKMTVISADGQPVRPVEVDEFRIGVAETYDVLVRIDDDRAYTIFAQSLDRSGYARGTLTPDLAKTAPVPALDPVADLTHADMGMMHRSGHDMAAMDHGSMQHGQHAMHGGGASMPEPIDHPSTEYGPHVDMRVVFPQYRLADPGVGLRNNGRRVLTYADLRNLHSTADQRSPDRELELHLTGNMERFMWSMNGVKFADAEPLYWKYGERVRITFVNDTMMNHPMHLHGMWSELETGDDAYLPRKHTIIVQPGSKISFRVTVDAKESWAFHCHLLYHMLGMFRTVTVS